MPVDNWHRSVGQTIEKSAHQLFIIISNIGDGNEPLVSDIIRDDFDQIAAFSDEGWNHNNDYHSFLLRQLPPYLTTALEIGCGIGTFARLLALRSEQVLALDLSPEMVRVAQERSVEFPNVRYEIADVMTYSLPDAHFDCIASIATLHHVPLDVALHKMKRALKPGGTILVLDLVVQELNLSTLLYNSLAIAVSLTRKLVYTGRLRSSPEARAAWKAHSEHDTYLPLHEVTPNLRRYIARRTGKAASAVALFDCLDEASMTI